MKPNFLVIAQLKYIENLAQPAIWLGMIAWKGMKEKTQFSGEELEQLILLKYYQWLQRQ